MQVAYSACADALAGHQARLHLGGVQPAGMLRGVVHDELAPERVSGPGAEGFNDTALGVRAQVVEDEVDPTGAAVTTGDSPQCTSEGAALSIG